MIGVGNNIIGKVKGRGVKIKFSNSLIEALEKSIYSEQEKVTFLINAVSAKLTISDMVAALTKNTDLFQKVKCRTYHSISGIETKEQQDPYRKRAKEVLRAITDTIESCLRNDYTGTSLPNYHEAVIMTKLQAEELDRLYPQFKFLIDGSVEFENRVAAIKAVSDFLHLHGKSQWKGGDMATVARRIFGDIFYYDWKRDREESCGRWLWANSLDDVLSMKDILERIGRILNYGESKPIKIDFKSIIESRKGVNSAVS